MKLSNFQFSLVALLALALMVGVFGYFYLAGEREQLQVITCENGSTVILPRTEDAAHRWISDQTSSTVVRLVKQGEDLLAEGEFRAESEVQDLLTSLRKEDVILREALVEATKARFQRPCDPITDQHYWAVIHSVTGKQINLISIQETVSNSDVTVTRNARLEAFISEFDFYKFGEI